MHTLAPFALLGVLVSPLCAQDVLHYKFDGNCGTEAVNHAAFSSVGNGTISGSQTAPWTTGRWNSALTGSDRNTGLTTWVATGWNIGAFTGDVSVSFWLRNRPGNPTQISFGYPFGAGSGQFRCFIGANGRLFVGGWGGSGSLVSTMQDLSPLLNAGWVHVVLALDAMAGTGVFYVNGVPEPTITLASPVNLLSTAAFAVGAQTPTGVSPSALETDEFYLTARVISAPEAMALSLEPRAGDGMFGAGCGPMLMGNGQRPILGNTGYALDIQGLGADLAWVRFGTNRCTLQGMTPLPTTLGSFHPSLANCNGYIDTDLPGLGPLVLSPAAGNGTLPFPLPNLPRLSGITAFAQCFTVNVAASQVFASNALSIGLGR